MLTSQTVTLADVRAALDGAQEQLLHACRHLAEAEAGAAAGPSGGEPPTEPGTEQKTDRQTDLKTMTAAARQARQSALQASSHLGKAITLATQYLQAQEAIAPATPEGPGRPSRHGLGDY